MIAVCGVPGTGASTLAAAVAQGFAQRPDGRAGVLLADLALNGSQASYHDACDVVPAVQELVDAHRHGLPDRLGVQGATFHVESRGYSLLLGLRRRRDWTALPRRASDAMLASLLATYRWVVADVTADFDGEAETGSIDIEDRNHLARSSALAAEVVAVVGTPDLRGIRSLVALIDELASLGVAADRILPVVNCSPRPPRQRSEAASAIAELTHTVLTTPTLFLPSRRELQSIHRCVDPVPNALVSPLTAAVGAVLAAAPAREDRTAPRGLLAS